MAINPLLALVVGCLLCCCVMSGATMCPENISIGCGIAASASQSAICIGVLIILWKAQPSE